MLGNAQGVGLHIKHQQKIIYKEKIHDTRWVSGGYHGWVLETPVIKILIQAFNYVNLFKN
jgi:hypothetical protein